MKVAIRGPLEAHHNKQEHEGMSLGALQNHAEGSDHFVNKNYRILTQHDEHPNHYKSNHKNGIFPPLIAHDHENHEWSHVGHARDIHPGEFRSITKTAEHPKGISHKDFYETLDRFHNQNMGRHHTGDPKSEAHMNYIEKHPLIQKFMDYHGNTGAPTGDYRQKKNLGVFEHPDGSKHIVARDHGFSHQVSQAYQDARKHLVFGSNAFNRR